MTTAGKKKRGIVERFFEAGLYSYACPSNPELMSGQESQPRKQAHVDTKFRATAIVDTI